MNDFEHILRVDLVKLWRADLGLRETDGPNRSPVIDSINARLRVPLGSPYCIGGLLVRGVEHLCTEHKLKNPVVMTGGSQFFWNNSPIRFRRMISPARAGDIGILQSINAPTQGHAYGFTDDELDGKPHLTIEYNTNLAGSRNGDGVYELTRTRGGTPTKKYRGAVDVVSWILSANN